MKYLISFSLIVLSFVCASAQTTEKPSPALQEADKLSAEVVKLFRAGKFNEAVTPAQRVVSIREKELGRNHVSVAQAWRNLAFIRFQLKDRKGAKEAFEKAYEIFEKNQPLPAEDEKMFVEMLEASAIYDAVDRDFTRAKKKLVRVVELRDKTYGTDALETANPLLRLAQVYQAQNDYEKALPPLLRALDIRTGKTEKLDDQMREIYDTTYCTLTKLGREDEASRLRDKFYPRMPDAALSSESKTIKGGVVNGKAIDLSRPDYPKEARDNRISGSVNVQVTIDETGKVIYACAISGPKELHQVTEAAAYRSKFTPTLLSGEPVKLIGVIVYNFVL